MNPGIYGLSGSTVAMPRPLLGRPSPIPLPDGYYHPEAADWLRRVVENGGTVSPATMRAVSQFCADIYAAELRNRFYRLNLFCGDQLAACLVPLCRNTSLGGAVLGNATDTNVNFVNADYSERGATLGGLKSNGSTKYLRTGLTADAMSVSDFHLSVYARGVEATGTSRLYIGNSAQFSTANTFLGIASAGTIEQGAIATASTSRVAAPSGAREGLLLVTTNNSRAQRYHLNAVQATEATANSAFQGNTEFQVFATEFAFVTLAKYMRGYSIGLGLSVAQIQAYRLALEALHAALERRV